MADDDDDDDKVGGEPAEAPQSDSGGDDVDEDQQPEETDQRQGTPMGGVSSPAAFCLLDGFSRDNTTNTANNNSDRRVTLVVTRLPALLGRTHDTKDAHFVGMGETKALSRKQCQIDFRWDLDGTLVMKDDQKDKKDDSDDNVFQYKPMKLDEANFVNPDKTDLSSNNKNKSIVNGFYTVTNLGKNRLYVNSHPVEQGETALLPDEAAIKIASYCMYFFIPTLASTKTITIKAGGKKRKRSDAAATSSSSTTKQQPPPPQSQPPVPDKASLSTILDDPSTTSSHSKPPGYSKAMVAELDQMSTAELLKIITSAVKNSSWDRREQHAGTALSLRAVIEAAKDPAMQAHAEGVSRGQVLDWIASSPQFKLWSEQMRTKLELRSFQANISKSMTRAGYERTSVTGRYTKWLLPPQYRQAQPQPKQDKNASIKKEEEDEKDKVDDGADTKKEDDSEAEEDESQHSSTAAQDNTGSDGAVAAARENDADMKDADDDDDDQQLETQR